MIVMGMAVWICVNDLSFFCGYNGNTSEKVMDKLFNWYDTDMSGYILLNELIGLVFSLINLQEAGASAIGGGAMDQ